MVVHYTPYYYFFTVIGGRMRSTGSTGAVIFTEKETSPLSKPEDASTQSQRDEPLL